MTIGESLLLAPATEKQSTKAITKDEVMQF